MAGSFDWLWEDTEIENKDPLTEGGGFSQAHTGQWTCARLYSSWLEEGLDPEDFDVKVDGKQAFTGSGMFVYWKNEEEASTAAKELGLRFPPRKIWRWEMPTASKLEPASGDVDLATIFGPTIGYDVPVYGLRSKKNRHLFHMMSLPSAVQALAVVSGFMEPIYNYASLETAIPDFVTEDLSTRLIGDGEYAESELWQARANIWAALGESDPSKYTVDQQGDFDTESKTLKVALKLAYDTTTFWASVVRINDPRLDALNKNDVRLKTLIISAFYKNKEEALKAIDVEETDSTNIPAKWKETGATEADWNTFVLDFTKDVKDKPEPVVRKFLQDRITELEKYGCTVDEVLEAL